MVTVYSQGNTLEAINERFDAIISDIGLADGTGYAVIREAKLQHKDVIGIGLSGYDSPADVEIGKLAGFDYHLSKPFDCEKLRSLLRISPRSPPA